MEVNANQEMSIDRPLGPQIARVSLSTELVEYLNSQMSDDLEDYSNNLVGKVKQELKFTKETTERVLKELFPYFTAYHTAHIPADSRHPTLSVEIMSGWYVRQFEGEYNPLHVHTGCQISCVGYLALPDGIEKEFSDDLKDHHPANGQIEFAYGGATTSYTKGSVRVVPRVGDFYIFPSGLWHTVYPFKTPGERRSFSMNVNVLIPPPTDQ